MPPTNRAHRRIELARILALEISGCLSTAPASPLPQKSEEGRDINNEGVREELSPSPTNAPHPGAS